MADFVMVRLPKDLARKIKALDTAREPFVRRAVEAALSDDTQAGSPAGRGSATRTRDNASATGAVTARGASRPAAPSQASVCKTHGRTANRPGGRCNLVGCMG
jgi:hypothetical protein